MFEVEPTGQPKIPENFFKSSKSKEPEEIMLFGNNLEKSLEDLKKKPSIFND